MLKTVVQLYVFVETDLFHFSAFFDEQCLFEIHLFEIEIF